MKSLLLNRVLLVLGIIGLFISGSLTVQHLFQLEIPCGPLGGCAVVARHASSNWNLGSFQIPVAAVGFLGYLFLTALAIFRGVTGKVLHTNLVAAGFLASAIGMVYSLYLQYISFTQIHARCEWCLSSAILMCITFVVYAMLTSEVNRAAADIEVPKQPLDLRIGIIGTAVAAISIFVVFSNAKKANIKVSEVEVDDIALLIPEKRNQLGPDTAKVTLVEFSDFSCPTCRRGFPKFTELARKYPETLRVIYRHYPLYMIPGHEQSLLAAVASEVAAEKGQFWNFATAVMSTEEPPKTETEIYDIARGLGISRSEIDEAIDKETDAQKRVFRDSADAKTTFNIAGTPTYLLHIPGKPIKKMDGNGLDQELNRGDVKALLEGKG